MLVCPQCQFENPNTNKFCEQCGDSLTHKICDNCGERVPFGELYCPSCDAFTGTLWWAIIAEQVFEEQPNSQKAKDLDTEYSEFAATETSPELDPLGDFKPVIIPNPILSNKPLQESSSDSPSANKSQWEETNTEGVSNRKMSSFKSNGKYLDPQKRYLIQSIARETKSKEDSHNCDGLLQGRVVDCKPLQKSWRNAVLSEEAKLKDDSVEKFKDSQLSDEQLSNGIVIPKLALPYLKLQDLCPTVPLIHDTWSEDGMEVLLVQDRSDWKLFSELWADQQLSMLEILSLLDEMTQIWEELSAVNCCQSLLELNNIRLDEDQTLCLQKLYQDSRDEQTTLKDLAQTWRLLFNQSGRTLFGPLVELLDRLAMGEIETTLELRSTLEEIAREQQSESISQTIDKSLPANVLSWVEEGSDAKNETSETEYEVDEGEPESMIYSSQINDQATEVLSMQLSSLTDAGYTDIGSQRDHNEDCFGLLTETLKQENAYEKNIQARGFYIVCDGMGGHAAGEVASAMAVETLTDYFQAHWQDELPDEETIRQGILNANQKIYHVNLENARSGSGRMGTTMVLALVRDHQIAIANVGDSRIYMVSRTFGLEQLTVDHEVGQREIQLGVDPDIAYARPDAFQLTQALGPRDNNFVKPDIQFLDLHEDTLLLLCSDGLSDNDLLENHWETYIQPLMSSKADLEAGLLKLIEFANDHNGHDNITGVIVRVKVKPLSQQQPLL